VFVDVLGGESAEGGTSGPLRNEKKHMAQGGRIAGESRDVCERSSTRKEGTDQLIRKLMERGKKKKPPAKRPLAFRVRVRRLLDRSGTPREEIEDKLSEERGRDMGGDVEGHSSERGCEGVLQSRGKRLTCAWHRLAEGSRRKAKRPTYIKDCATV